MKDHADQMLRVPKRLAGERALGRWDHCFVAPDERIPVLEAGPEGVQAVILQFPTKTIAG